MLFIYMAWSYPQVQIIGWIPPNKVNGDHTSGNGSYNNAATVNSEGHLQQESHVIFYTKNHIH